MLDSCQVKSGVTVSNQYCRITSTKSPSFCMTTFCANLSNLNDPLTSVTLFQLLCEQINTGTSTTTIAETRPIYAHVTFRTFPNCDVGQGPVMLPAPEAGDFLELILLYIHLRRMIFFSYFAVRFILSKYFCYV